MNRVVGVKSAIARLVALLVAAATALLCLGCDEHLVGTYDAEIDYRVDPPPASIDKLASDVNARLGAAKISADVDPRGTDRITLTIDRDSAKAAFDLLGWRGGLDVYVVDPAATQPAAMKTSEALDALATIALTSAQKGLIQAIDEAHARVLIVKAAPIAELRDAIASVDTPDGKSVAVHLTPAGVTSLEAAFRANEGAELAFARATSVLSTQASPVLDAGALVFALGDDLYAYARAHRVKLLLKSPSLPTLVRERFAPLPMNVPLATSCVVIPMLLSFAWIFFVRRFDRAHPEPMWLILSTFVLGGLSVIPAGFAEVGLMSASPYLDPTLMTLGGQLIAFPAALVIFTLVVGFSEEVSKFFGAFSLAYHRREFDEPIDGIVYGAVSALGFAAVENVKYFTVGRLSAVIVIVRTFMSIPAHMFFGAIWGYALGQKLVDKKVHVVLFVALAALVHGAFDTFLSIDGMAIFALVLNVGLASLFVVLLRRALRHGVVNEAAARAAAGPRDLFRLGSPAGFLASAIAMHLLAALVFLLGVYMEIQHRRVGFGFVSAMSSFLVLLIASAYFLSSTMPLDAAVDSYGVTFAGAARAWSTVRAIERMRGRIVLRSSDGDLVLGPGADDVLDELARTIMTHRLALAA